MGTLHSYLLLLLAVFVINSFHHANAIPEPDNDYLNALWVAESQGVLKLTTTNGEVLFEITDAHDVEAIAVDDRRGNLWIYGCATLSVYAFNGTLRFSKELDITDNNYSTDDNDVDDLIEKRHCHRKRGHYEGNSERKRILFVNPHDGGVWLALDKSLYKLDDQGEIQSVSKFSNHIRAITFDRKRNIVWLANESELNGFKENSSDVIVSIKSDEEIKDIEYDVMVDGIWVVTDDGLSLYDVSGVKVKEYGFDGLEFVAADGKGHVWVSGKKTLYRVDSSSGLVFFSVNPFNGKYGEHIFGLVSDSGDLSAWIAGEKKIVQVTNEGQLQNELLTNSHVSDLALYSDVISPEIKFVSPQQDAYLNNSRPVLKMNYSDIGIGVDPDTLDIWLLDQSLQVDCAWMDSFVECSPSVAFSDGAITLQVSIKDFAGNESEPDSLDFTVDTRPPIITLTAPVDGQFTNDPAFVINGSVNERAKVTLNNSSLELGLDNTFQHTASLVEGVNLLKFEAVDLAGNEAILAVTVTLDTVPPHAIKDGAIVAGKITDGKTTITLDIRDVDVGGSITLVNRRTGETWTRTADGSESIDVVVNALTGDRFDIFVTDRAGNKSETSKAIVSDGLPPDPSAIAPGIDISDSGDLFIASEFLYTGKVRIQQNMAPGVITKERVAVIRGKITDRDGAPLSGIKLTIKDHPEYGYTLSRVDGAFDMVVNGGGKLVIDYQKEGFLPVQRRINTPWKNYVWVEDVVMIPLDRNATDIILQNSTEMQIAKGSSYIDQDGARQTVLLFPRGTTATMVLKDGTKQQLSSMNVRATEYTVGSSGPYAMPGELPATSGYTYAVELSIDEAISAGATRVEFNQPISFYVDNFLGFPVGGVVPVGWYDREKSAWVPSNNGRIIEILSTNGGVAQLDVDGDGIKDTGTKLDNLGFTDDELQKLANLYKPGKTLWRTLVTHFSSWDCNWPYGFPFGATTPILQQSVEPVGQAMPEAQQNECQGCIIQPQSQSLGEELPITGTPYNLYYNSKRMPGNRSLSDTTVRLTGNQLPPGLKRVEVSIYAGGQRIKRVFAAVPNLKISFSWNGKDAWGRYTTTTDVVYIVTYVYRAVYYPARDDFKQSFLQLPLSSVRFGPDRSRQEARLYRRFDRRIYKPYPFIHENKIGGWTIDVHHQYEPHSMTLSRGDGGVYYQRSKTIMSSIWRDLGPGSVLSDIEIDETGNLVVADAGKHTIWIDDNGIRALAGTGQAGFSGDGGTAVQAQLNQPSGIAIGPNGNIYIADTGNNRIRVIDSKSGIISTLAGTGVAGFGGDNGAATAAILNSPSDVVVDDNGTVYIADSGNNRIRMINHNGVITTVAGNGMTGLSGDNGASVKEGLNIS